MTNIAASHVPMVSVVVPNYNHARFLHQRLDSIIAQTFTDFELILLDDCSTDDSREILSSYQSDLRVKLCFNKVNSGSTFKQWNKGVALALGKYIWMAESDDSASPVFLQTLVSLLESNSRCSLAYCQSYDMDEKGLVRGVLPQWISYPDPRQWDSDFIVDGKTELARNFVCGTPIQNASAALIRRSAFVAAGTADENFRLTGDWKLYIDLLLQGDLGFVAQPMNNYRRHTTTVRNTVRASGLNIMEEYRVFDYLQHRVSLPTSMIRWRLNQLARLRAEARMASGISADRLADIAALAKQVDPLAELRFTQAKLMMSVKKFVRASRSRLGRPSHGPLPEGH